MEFPQYNQLEFDKRYYAWKSGNLRITEAFPHVSQNALEFICTGVTDDEWNIHMNGYKNRAVNSSMDGSMDDEIKSRKNSGEF